MSLHALLLLLSLLFPQYVVGQHGGAIATSAGSFSIAHDAVATPVACGNSATCTVAITVGAGAHPIILVVIGCDAGFSGCSLAATGGVVDSTNSVDFTSQCTLSNDTTDSTKLWMCWVAGVPSGANSIAITLTHAPGVATFEATASSYTGVNQSSPWDVTPATFQHTSIQNISESVTTLTANDWLADAVFVQNSNGTSGLVATSPQNTRTSVWVNSNIGLGQSDQGPVVTPGATSDGWNYTATADYFNFIVGALKAG
ncbi:MAG: hypothetical protein ACRD8A_12585 [Candidatus Acidiferrales bacterium]